MIVTKTELGLQVMKDRSVALTPRQRSALILCDGRKSLDQVLAATAGVGVTREDIAHLFDLGLVTDSLAPGAASTVQAAPAIPAALRTAAPVPATPAPAVAPAATPATDAAAAPRRSNQQRYQDAYPIATRLTASLGLRGFRLNLAVEAAGSYEELAQLAPRIREAVGADKCAPLDRALGDG